MNIIFDLDGTLIDSSERMYRLFQRLIPESIFTKDEYWKLKRDKENHKIILEKYFPQYNFEIFNRKWLSMIEMPEYIDMDTKYSDTIEILDKLSKEHQIILLTARQSKTELVRELEKLNMKQYFNHILITEAKISKEGLLINAENDIFVRSETDLFISDMGKDIKLGNKMRYRTVAITHGFMSGKCLNEYEPDYVIDELSQLICMI